MTSALLALIEKAKPGSWRPWERSLKAWDKDLEERDLGLTSRERRREEVRFRLIWDGQTKLAARDGDELSRVVGALVADVTTLSDDERDEARDSYRTLCENLKRNSASGLVRQVGFFVFLVERDPLNSEAMEWRQFLRDDAEIALQDIVGSTERIHIIPSPDESSAMLNFRFWALHAINAFALNSSAFREMG